MSLIRGSQFLVRHQPQQCARSDLKKENNSQKKDQTTLLREKELLTEKINLFNQEEAINKDEIKTFKDEIKTLDFLIQKLADSIQGLNTLIVKERFVNDSLRNLKIHNIISLKDIVSNSNFSKSKINGTWSIKTLLLNKENEYIDYNDIYSYNDSKHNSGINYKYDGKLAMISRIAFTKPNIAVLELKDKSKMTCLYEIKQENLSGANKNFVIKFSNTNREELKFTISLYEKAYIFNYNYRELISFFDRDDYGARTEKIRIKKVNYDYYGDSFEQYNIQIIGVFE